MKFGHLAHNGCVIEFFWCRRIFVLPVKHVNQSIGAGTHCVFRTEYAPVGNNPPRISDRVRMRVKTPLDVRRVGVKPIFSLKP